MCHLVVLFVTAADGSVKRFRVGFTANGRNDHMTTFTLHLPLAVFSFLVKLSSFVSTSKARIILLYSHPCTHFFQENINANLAFRPFVVNAILNLSNATKRNTFEGWRCSVSFSVLVEIRVMLQVLFQGYLVRPLD